ncbi:MAG: hypothetical protein MRZ79_27685 [Bacteroidia bacterium]|nr:hypothetical protein [Bacteroidia bacterium]
MNRLSIYFILFVSLLFTQCKTEEPMDPEEPEEPTVENLTEIPSINSGESYVLMDNIENGEVMDDLSWAALSNVACFPATRFIEFEGNQLFYQVDIPQGSELIATVIPTGERKRINIYGYINFDGTNTPPLSVVTSCEAGYEIYVGNPDLNKAGEPQDISFAQAINRGFTAFICVSGAQGVLEGDFELKLELKPM